MGCISCDLLYPLLRCGKVDFFVNPLANVVTDTAKHGFSVSILSYVMEMIPLHD